MTRTKDRALQQTASKALERQCPIKGKDSGIHKLDSVFVGPSRQRSHSASSLSSTSSRSSIFDLPPHSVPRWDGYIANFIKLHWRKKELWGSVSRQLYDNGYIVETEGELKPLNRKNQDKPYVNKGIRIRDGQPVFFRVVDTDSREPAFIKHLNEMQKAKRHLQRARIVDLLDVVTVDGCGMRAAVMITKAHGGEIDLMSLEAFDNKREWLNYLWQLFSVVAFLHSTGFAHGDLLGHNILYDKRIGVLILIDFEWAAFVDDRQRPATVLPAYTAKIDYWWAVKKRFRTKQELFAASLNRHALQNREEWSDPRTRDVVLLGCLDITVMHRLFPVKGLPGLLRKMQNATSQSGPTMQQCLEELRKVIASDLGGKAGAAVAV